MRATRLTSLFAGTLVALVLPAAAPAAVQVTTTVDEQDGECALDCSLRDGVNIAGRTGDVVLVPGGTYTLGLGQLVVNNATIQGAGAGVTIIRAGSNVRVVQIVGSATITGVTITGGVNGFSGAGIEVGNLQVATTLNLSESAVSGNASTTGSNGFGGGISVNGLATLVMTNTTVSGNRVQGGDGVGVGAGIYVNANGRAELRNSTVSGNIAEVGSSPGFGGGVAVEDAGTLVMENVTVAANTAGSAGGIARDDDGFTGTPPPAIAISDTIVAGNSVGQCSGIGAHSGDYNLSSDASCAFTATGDRQNTNPQLGPLQVNNGTGRTATHALPLGSPAINAGDPTTCKATDQRGAPRPAGGCDIGAFEYVAPMLRVITAVVNDNGGTLGPGNFSAHVRAGAADVPGSPQPGSANGTVYTLNAGSSYTVAADAVAGYALSVSGDCAANGSITLQEGQNRTCTITANDIAPTLRVITTVVNNSGGAAVASNFSAHVRQNGTEVTGSPQSGVGAPGTLYTLATGTYAVTADGVAGYGATGSGACNAAGSVTLAVGQTVTCTITVDDIAPLLRVITTVVNNNGGTAVASSFSAHVRQSGTEVTGSPQAGAGPPGTQYTLTPGTYAVTADGVSGYAPTGSGACNAAGSVTLALGQNVTCTITVDDVAPTLRVITTVVNNSGGTAVASGFSAHVRQSGTEVTGSPQPGVSAPGTLYTLSAATYAVTADGVAGYAPTGSGACNAAGSVTLALGQNVTCTITVDDVAPTLRVITAVANDEGGTLAPASFTAHVRTGAIDVGGSPQPGTAAGTVYTLSAGPTYTVSADAVAGYSLAVTGTCAANGTITLALGQNAMCTITATDNPPTLRVITNVVNDNGGTLAPGNLSAHVRAGANDVNGSPQPGTATGTLYTLSAGVTYTVAVDAVTGYVLSVSGDCAANGTITMQLDQDRSCTITANDVAPTLRVITAVTNDNGGTRAPAGFNVHVRQGANDVANSPQPGSAAGTDYTLSGGTTYTVAADAVTGYTFAITGSCAANGTVALQVGQNPTCTITANDVAPTLRVITAVTNDAGGTLTPAGVTAHVRQGANDVPNSPQVGSAAGTDYTLTGGTTYTVAADNVTGYAFAVTGSCAGTGTVTLQVGQNLTCTITGTDIAPTLRVITEVKNDDGGSLEIDDVAVHVRRGGNDVPGSPQPGATMPGAAYTVIAGQHVVAADAAAGYSASYGEACAANGAITLALAQSATCRVTMDDGAATLNVATQVTNDDGGSAVRDDFDVSVLRDGAEVAGAPGSASTPFSLPGNRTYMVAAGGVPGYTFAVSGDCAAVDGSVTLPLGQTRSCTITANDVAPKLTVVTQVVNDHGGSAAPGGFTVHVRRGGADVAGSPQPGSAGTTYTLTAGAHVVAVDAVSGYGSAISGDCAGDGSITLGVGDVRTCTVIASDDPPPQPSFNAQQLPPPEPGKNVNALPKSGTVKVKLPGSAAYVDLSEARQLPVGTVIDATKGHVTLVAAADDSGGTATAEFWAGIFRIGQTKGSAPSTVLTLVEKLSCPKSGRANVAAKKKKKRRLWGDGSGKFQTKGKHSAATVVGTRWLVEDSCRSTLTRVVRGRVSVRDFVKKKTVIVRAGKKYVARARR